LPEKIARGEFREDLYFRLAEIVVDIPPLRSRVGDAVSLAHVFVERFRAEYGRGLATLSPDALDAIERHSWPGNVRELENCMRRAVIMSEGERITAADLGLARDQAHTPPPTLRAVREHAEREAVLKALARGNGNILQSAAQLGISRPTLYDLMHRFGLRDPAEKRTSS
jgi:two-component system NtrC family response regulator